MASSSSPPLLLVDGYNIIGAWPDLKEICDRHSLEAARQQLVEALINYTSFRGLTTQVVFDAHYQKNPSHQEEFTQNVSVYYTAFSETADTYIEKICAASYHQLNRAISRIIVATSDRAHQQTVTGYGAEWLSALQLISDIDVISKKTQQKQRSNKQTRGRFLFHSLDAKVQERLSQLRKGNL